MMLARCFLSICQ